MKYHISLILIVLLIISCNKNSDQGTKITMERAQELIVKNNHQLLLDTKAFLREIGSKPSREILLSKTKLLREKYKTNEWTIAYFMPQTFRNLNGAPVPEIEFEEGTVLDAQGLQVLEELVLEDKLNYPEIERSVKLILNNAQTIESYFNVNTISKSQIFDAVLLEIHRLSTLGIAGFDTTIPEWNAKEMQIATQSVVDVCALLQLNQKNHASPQIKNIKYYANELIDFYQKNTTHKGKTPNYLFVLKNTLMPLYTSVNHVRKEMGIPHANINYAVNLDAPNLFNSNAINTTAFEEFPEKIDMLALSRLGKQLFTDPILSDSENRSCVSCHNPELAFTDGKKTNESLSGSALKRNTPSLNYAVFQHGQFWDMRRENLASQSEDVISNKDEMHGDLKKIFSKIIQNTAYRKTLMQIFKKNETSLSSQEIKLALAAHIASLPKFNSLFDSYFTNTNASLPSDVQEGFNLFVGKARCATCHFLPLFNGTVPPDLKKSEQEVLGVPINPNSKILDPDLGRGRMYPYIISLAHSFKTPTLRNVSKSGPYMHNGTFKSLKEVMDFYNKGGSKGSGISIDIQTFPETKLDLSESEIASIIAFMKALEDRP